MGIRIYRVVPAEDVDTLSYPITTNVIYNVANTEALIEFVETPPNGLTTLTQTEAKNLIGTEEWKPIFIP